MARWDSVYSDFGSAIGFVITVMQCVFGVAPQFSSPHALTIGNFDGVHLGHQAVIAQAKAAADERGLPLTVLVFEPQPKEYFAKRCHQIPPPRLMSVRDKVHALAELGVDCVWCVRFQRVQPMEASEFVDSLIERAKVKHLIVGDDFRFGADRKGDFAYLAQRASQGLFTLEQCATHELDGARISSSRIRDRLSASDFEGAHALLGRPFSMSGRVVYGQQLGRRLGFPTANIRLAGRPPISGVFACHVTLEDGSQYNAVANVGTRPTVDGQRAALEVYLHDFNGVLYRQRLTVIPLFFIRPEQKFEGVQALSAQIAKDNARARELLLT